MSDQVLELRLNPAPSLRGLAKRCWEQATRPAIDRIVSEFCNGWWSAVWEDGKLRIKRRLITPAGAAFGGGAGYDAAAGATLGTPIVEYNGATITLIGLSNDIQAFDEMADIIVRLATFLKARCRESGWACVAVSGDTEAARKLERKLRVDPDAPAVFDAEMANAVERSRGGRS